jgi:hypothetical protein
MCFILPSVTPSGACSLYWHFTSYRFAVFKLREFCVSEWDFVQNLIPDAVMKPSTHSFCTTASHLSLCIIT